MLQVIFRKRATSSRALLRKMTYEDKASYDSTAPCSATMVHSLTRRRALTFSLHNLITITLRADVRDV